MGKESKASASKLGQSPAEIHKLPAKETGREICRAACGFRSVLPACNKADTGKKIPQPEVNYKTHPPGAQGEALDQTSDAGM